MRHLKHLGYTLLGAVVVFVGGFCLMAFLVLFLGLFGYIHDNPICLLWAALITLATVVCWFVGRKSTPFLKTLFM